jgi:hypothetical protein
MRFRACRLFIVLLALAWAALPAGAAKSPPQVEPLGIVPPVAAPAAGVAATCVVGETHPPVYSVNYLLPPDDAYYTLLDRSSCAACTEPGGVWLDSAHVRLHFPVVCTQPVAISVVAALGDSCPIPDPSRVLCGVRNYDLTPPATGIFDFALPLASECGLVGKAFLCVNFVSAGAGCSSIADQPRLVTTDSCRACRSYNVYRGGFDDLCAVYFPGNLVMSAGVSACAPGLAVEMGQGARAWVSPATPNPSPGGVSFRLVLPVETDVRIVIHDVAGRVVRRLEEGPRPAGNHQASWDGRDAAGRSVGPGVYFCRVKLGAQVFVRPVVLRR